MIIDYDTAMQVKARAAAQGLRVMVCITDEIHHRVDYLIPSSDGDGIYIVSEHSANDYDCTCPAGQHQKPCKHIGAALLFGYYAHHIRVI